MTLTASGRLLIGTASEATYLLDVNGTGRFSGELRAATYLTLSEDATYPGPYYTLGFSGKSNGCNRIFADKNGSDGIYIASATGTDIRFRPGGGTTDYLTIASTGAATFSNDVTIGASSQLYLTSGDLRYSSNAGYGIVSQNGNRLVSIQNGAFGVTGAATFSSSVTSQNMYSVSDNSEQITIKTATDNNKQLIFGRTATNAKIIAVTQGIGYVPLCLQPDGGNVLIGTTTDAGYKLDVNGTGRFSSDLTIGGSANTQSSLSLTRLKGYSNYYDVSNRYGDYGKLIFNADSSWTSAARRWLITNAVNNTTFAIIRSVDSTTDPSLGNAGAVTSGTVDFQISNAGAATFSSRLMVNGATDDGSNALQVNGGIVATSTIAAVVPSNVDMFVFNNTGATYTKSCVVASMTATGGTGSYFFYGQQSTSTVALKIFSNGNIQNTNNSYGAISDARLKENIIDATPKLADLMKVKVRNYNLKGESNKQLGVISQELEEIFPNMIEESTNLGENVKIKGVKYSVFVPMLIKAVQEQQVQINELKQLLNK
jgi:hypothetical protein